MSQKRRKTSRRINLSYCPKSRSKHSVFTRQRPAKIQPRHKNLRTSVERKNTNDSVVAKLRLVCKEDAL
jgi:hypothetical protein